MGRRRPFAGCWPASYPPESPPPSPVRASDGGVLLEVAEQRRLGLGADDLLDHLATGEHIERRYRRDAVRRRRLRVLVDVELDDVEIVLRGRDLLEHRGDHAARPAPFG